MSLAVLGLAACDDFEHNHGIEQVNPQEPLMQAENVKVAYGAAIEGSELNLNNYLNAAALTSNVTGDKKNEMVPVIKTETTDLTPGSEVVYLMQIADNANYENAQEVDVRNDAVQASTLEDVFFTMFGKEPVSHQVWVRFAAYLVSGLQYNRVGGDDTWLAAKEVTFVPVDAQFNELTYDLQIFVGGTLKETVALGHSATHPYDDPNFKTVVNITDADASWKIVSPTGKEFGPENATAAKGKLVLDGEAGKFEGEGGWQISANMTDRTYEVIAAHTFLTTPGGGNGWTVDAADWRLETSDFINYWGYAWLDGEFKLAAGTWDLSWGLSDEEGVLTSANGGNIPVPAAGIYYLTFNINTGKFAMEPITQIGMIGGFNGWGGDEVMTIADNGKTITGTLTMTDPNTEWKFRMNGGWDINLGGAFDDLQPGGANLVTPEAGTYTVSLDLASMPRKCTVTKN